MNNFKWLRIYRNKQIIVVNDSRKDKRRTQKATSKTARHGGCWRSEGLKSRDVFMCFLSFIFSFFCLFSLYWERSVGCWIVFFISKRNARKLWQDEMAVAGNNAGFLFLFNIACLTEKKSGSSLKNSRFPFSFLFF